MKIRSICCGKRGQRENELLRSAEEKTDSKGAGKGLILWKGGSNECAQKELSIKGVSLSERNLGSKL